MKSTHHLRALFLLISLCTPLFSQNPVRLYFDGTYRRQASHLKEMYDWLVLGYTSTATEKNSDWVIEIDGGIYDTSNWHDILWHGRSSTPNTGYTLTIEPTPGDTVIIRGNDTVDRALKIGSLTEGLILENLIFDAFYRTQILVYQSKNCVIRNCTFQNMNREDAWTAISIQDCQGEWGNITVENNTFINLDSPGIGLHPVYLTRSDNNLIRNNTIHYTSGGVFKCVDGSDFNHFDANTLIDGCGDLAYFIGRNGSGQTTLSRGNAVMNTQCLIQDGKLDSHVYDNSAYRFVRKFVYAAECCEFPEYEWPEDHQATSDSTRPFYIPLGHTGNNFNQIRSDFEVDVDRIIDVEPAHIYLSSNAVGNANNALYRGKYYLETTDTNFTITADYYHTYNEDHTYLRKVIINDISRKPRKTTITFDLLTCEGEVIRRGGLAGSNGELIIEKWLIESTETSQWISDIEGADQWINISSPDSNILELYTLDNNLLETGSTLDYLMEEGVMYKVFAPGTTEITLRPTYTTVAIYQPEVAVHPGAVHLLKNYPNPFNPSTTIEYDLPEPSEVSLAIYDIAGREVKMLAQGPQLSGTYDTHWDGTDRDGDLVAGGMYFARLQTGEFQRVVKMLYLR